MKQITLAVVYAAAILFPAYAQTARPQPTPNDTLKSHEVLADGRVTFRLYAPKASEVSLGGDFVSQGRATGGKMTKDEDGVWSLTVGPLVPDFYVYSFTVDGVKTSDPKNGFAKPGLNDVNSMVEVPGEQAAFEAARPVPHGEIRIAYYESSTLDQIRSMHVYTPPGYESSKTKYPVFYLLHGSGDDDAGWSTVGRAGFILDNLIAANKAKPMLVVMPNGSMPRPETGMATPGSPAASRAQEQFADELMKNVIPYVEKHYRVLTNRENRALAGLSMGGGQTIRVAPANLDKFAWIGVWSSGVREQASADFESRSADFLGNSERTNKMVKLFWVGVGEKDAGANASAKNLVKILNDRGIRNEFHESAGAHTWINWRHYLNDFAQQIFR